MMRDKIFSRLGYGSIAMLYVGDLICWIYIRK